MTARRSRLSAILGTNFSDGRGNVTIGFEGYKREASFDINHDQWTDYWARTDTVGTFAGFLNGVNGYACNGPDCPSPGAVNALFNDSAPGSVRFLARTDRRPARAGSTSPPTGRFSRTAAAACIGPTARCGSRSRSTAGNIGLLNSYDTNVPTGQLPVEYQNLKWFHQRNYIGAPQDRHSFFASGTFDVSRARARVRTCHVRRKRHEDDPVRHERDHGLGNPGALQPDDGQPGEPGPELSGSRGRRGRARQSRRIPESDLQTDRLGGCTVSGARAVGDSAQQPAAGHLLSGRDARTRSARERSPGVAAHCAAKLRLGRFENHRDRESRALGHDDELV